MESEIDGNQSCCEVGKVHRCRNRLAAPIWPLGAILGNARGVLFMKNAIFRTFRAQEPPDGILVLPGATSSILGVRRHQVLLVRVVFIKLHFPVR